MRYAISSGFDFSRIQKYLSVRISPWSVSILGFAVATGGSIAGACATRRAPKPPAIGSAARELRRIRRWRMWASEGEVMDAGGLELFYPLTAAGVKRPSLAHCQLFYGRYEPIRR